MSYFAGKDEAAKTLYQEADAVELRRSPRSTKKSRDSRKSTLDVEEYHENNAVGNFADPLSESEDDRRNRRGSRKDSRRRSKSRNAEEDDEDEIKDKHGLFGRSSNSKRTKGRKKKSRQDRVYDDVYGATNYQEVDDGIVGCADDLCVNKEALLDEEAVLGKGKQRGSKKSIAVDEGPNTGEPNKNLAENEEVYIVKQRFGYFSIFFGILQVIVLALMMWQCGIAPMNINPMYGPYPDALSEWGGKNSVLIVEDGEWWRLMTPILLHAGLIHLFCNVAVQLELGVFFEREWGSMTWLIIYLSSAMGSSVLSVIVMPDAVSVGSSGAVMGLFGGKIAEIICRCCERNTTVQDRVAHQVRKEQCMGVGCSVVVVLAFSFIPYVDWAAHLGGLIAGLFVGFMTFSIHMESYCLRLLWFLVGMGLTLGFFIPCIDMMYSGDIPMNEELRDVCGYYQQNFEDYECNCMREEYLANVNFWKNKNNADGDGERFLFQTTAFTDSYSY